MSLGKTISISLARALFTLYLFTIPLQIRTLMFGGVAFKSGLFSEYVAIFVYAADIFLILAAFCFGIYLLFSHHLHDLRVGDKAFMLVACALGVATLMPLAWSENPELIFGKAARIAEGILACFMIINMPGRLRWWIQIIVASILLQGGIALFQYLLQGDLGLQVIGEPILMSTDITVARFAMQDQLWLRAHGTLFHPDILATITAIALFLYIIIIREKDELLESEENAPLRRHAVILALLFGILILTFSRSVWVAALGGIVSLLIMSGKARFMKGLALPGALFLVACLVFLTSLISGENVFAALPERIWIAAKIFMENPLGVGASSYSFFMRDVADYILKPWELIPFPNIFVIQLIESGILGLCVSALLWLRLFIILRIHRSSPACFVVAAMWIALFIMWNTSFMLESSFAGQQYLWLSFGLGIAALTESHSREKG